MSLVHLLGPQRRSRTNAPAALTLLRQHADLRREAENAMADTVARTAGGSGSARTSAHALQATEVAGDT